MKRVLVVLMLCIAQASSAGRGVPADLGGYAEPEGAITVQYGGDTVDPYFALQALMLASGYGLDVRADAIRWAEWLRARQKPDGTFQRFCRERSEWVPCKHADADDSMLAMWLKFLDGMPTELARRPAWRSSRRNAEQALRRLADPQRRLYIVSAAYPHSLLMDNLEVWAYPDAHQVFDDDKGPTFTESMQRTFWDGHNKRFLVSTQPEQKTAAHKFYPDAVAQIFPLVVGYPHVPGGARAWYLDWMRQHRKEWLAQVDGDFAWGMVALVALDQDDRASAACWLLTTQPFRHSPHWTVTDEVVAQVLAAHQVRPARDRELCQ